MQAEAADEPLHVAQVVTRDSAVDAIKQCWQQVQHGSGVIESAEHMVELVKQVGSSKAT